MMSDPLHILVGHGDVSGLQKFVNSAPWQSDDVQAEVQAAFEDDLVPSAKGSPAGVVGIIDESAFAKKGVHSAGVARQHDGRLGERVAAAVDDGEGSQREIAATFRVSLSFVSRLLRRRRDAGTLAPQPHGGGPPPALGPDDRRRLDELIREQPDATLEQLRQRGGFTVQPDDDLARPARPATDPQEEDPARRRARPARRAEEAPLVPQGGRSGSSPDGWSSWTRRG